MLSCLRSVTRALPLLGAVVLMLLVAADAVAQVTTYTQFPFLSPRTSQSNMLANAFAFQMQLFAGISGANGAGLSAVRMLAMFATLVGMMMIIFFPKYQRMPIVMTWFLLVIIVLFVPLSSKLIFYPIKVNKGLMLTYNDRAPPVQDGSDCDKPDKWAGCGFTPQLAAAHLGSVLQMISSDIFRSAGWGDLLERQAANTKLYSMKDFGLGKPWVDEFSAFKGCGLDLKEIVHGTAPTTSVPPRSLSSLWNEIGTAYKDPDGNFTVPPPFIVLPDTKDEIVNKLKWDDSTIRYYEQGITVLCDEFCKLKDKKQVLVDTTGTNGSISIEDAFASMLAENPELFEPVAKDIGAWNDIKSAWGWTRPSAVLNGPGAYITPQSKLTSGSDTLKSRTCYVAPTAWTTWGYILRQNEDVSTEKCIGNRGVGNPLQIYDPNLHKTTYEYFTKNYIGTGNTSDNLALPWSRLVKVFKKKAFWDMPVARGEVTLPKRTQSQKFPEPTVEVMSGMSCFAQGKKIVDTAIRGLEDKQVQTYKYFDRFAEILRGTASVPTTVNSGPGSLKYELNWPAMTGADYESVNQFDPEKAEMVNLMAARMNEVIRKVNFRDLNSDAQRQEAMRTAMVDSVLDLMLRVSMQMSNVQESALTDNAANDGSHTADKLIGNEFLAENLGWASFNLGKIMAAVGAFFTGALANAYIQFLSVLVDFTLMTIIVVTPLLFIFGLLIPSAASGVLTIAVMSVLILKFVPVTLILMNGVGGMIYDLLPSSVGTDADFAQNLLILAMAGLYTNIVGLTFFLMFKLGDPAAFLGRLTALDGSAKQLAERGQAAAIAAAGTLLTLGAGAVTGGVSAGLLAGKARRLASAMGANEELAGSTIAAASTAYKGLEEKFKKKPGDGDGEGDGTPGTPDAAAEGMEGITPEEFEKSKDLLTHDNMGWFGKKAKQDEFGNLTNGELNKMIANGSIDKNGKRYSFINEDGKWDIGVEDLNNPSALLPGTALSADESMNADILGGELQARRENMAKLNETVRPGGDGSVAGGTNTQQVGGNTQGGNDITRPIAGGGAAETPHAGSSATGGIPAAVTVVGGKLDVGNVDQLGVAASATVAERVASIEADETAQQKVAARKEIQSLMDKHPEHKAMLQNYMDQLDGENVSSPADIQNVMRSLDKDIKPHGTSLSDSKAEDQALINQNQQIAANMASIREMPAFKAMEAKLKAGDKLTDQEEALKKRYESLKDTDTTAMVTGDVATHLASTERLKMAMEARGRADAVPSIGQAMASGLYGAFAGAGGGLAKIPVLGPAISEALNEYTQAPERARVWNEAGGFMAWKGKQTDASRMGFYQKEMAPIAAAAQYDSMMQRGGFSAQYEASAEAARMAVEKSRAYYEASNASRRDKMEPLLTTMIQQDRSFMSTTSSDPAVKREQMATEVTRRYNEILANPDKMVAQLRDGVRMQIEGDVTASAEFKNLAPSGSVRDDFLNHKIDMHMNAVGFGMDGKFQVGLNANELVGLDRIGAADRLASVRQEALMMQGPSLTVVRAKHGLDGQKLLKEVKQADGSTKLMNETEEVAVTLTPDLLYKFRGDLNTKKHANTVDEMMIAHYGLMEKQYLRGDAKWNSTRNMNRSAAAAGMFARKDVSTDYLIGGHMKMVQGKERFKEGQGQYKTLVQMRNENNGRVAEEFAKVMKVAGGQLAQAVKDLKIDESKITGTGLSLQINQRAEIEKQIGKNLLANKEYLPLDLIFESAEIKGRSSYKLKALKAPSLIASEDSAVWVEVDKARRAAMNSMMSQMHKSASKAGRIDVGGLTAELNSPLEAFTELMDAAYGTGAEKKFKAFSDTVAKMGTTHNLKQQDVFRTVKNVILKGGKDNGKEIVSYANETVMNTFMNSLSPEEAAKLRAQEGKLYRIKNGRWEFGYAKLEKGKARPDDEDYFRAD